MDILSSTERQGIADVIDNVADTYFNTSVSITRTGVNGVLPDRWNSATTQTSGASQGSVYQIFSMIEYVNPSTSYFMDSIGGADGDFDVLITTTVKRAVIQSIITSNRKCVIRDGDTIEIENNEDKYRIVAVLFDGHFDSSGQLLIFKCKRETLK